MNPPRFVVIIPAKNEEAHLGALLESLVQQTAPPLRCVVVSDGSTDRTDDIAREYGERCEFIEFLRFEKGDPAIFGSKVLTFNAGYERLAGLEYDFIGNLDADITLAPDYFERLFDAFDKHPRYGLAGGLILERVRSCDRALSYNRATVPGSVQMFRRAVFEAIGGYRPLPHGGIDATAEVMVRMQGYETRTLEDCKVWAHRPMQTGRRGLLGTRFNKGLMNYELGYHPLFQLLVSARWLCFHPVVLGSIWMQAGYWWAQLRRLPRQVSDEFVEFVRGEQLERMRLRRPRRAADREKPGVREKR